MLFLQIEKIPRAEVEKELAELSVPAEAVDGILEALAVRSLEAVEGMFFFANLNQMEICVAELTIYLSFWPSTVVAIDFPN